jgi:biopolymer transport protein TolQ
MIHCFLALPLSDLPTLNVVWIEQGVMSLVLQAGTFAKAILIILLALSVIAWAITINKYWQFRAFRRDYSGLMDILRPNVDVQTIYANAVKKSKGPISRIFEEGYLTFSEALQQEPPHRMRAEALSSPQALTNDRSNHTPESDVKQRLEAATASECSNLESGLSFLASITTVSPFIGLLGTVWGVMGAFLGISQSGNADLSVVAPGIAEALITTVAGLAVAIPAVFCHNFLTGRLRLIEDDLERLATELNIYFSNYWYREKSKAENRFGHQRDAAR